MARKEKDSSIMKKLQFSVSSEMLGEYALAGVGATLYTIVPTALNLSGPEAMVVGGGAVIALGILLESPVLIGGAVFVMLVHLIYRYGSNATMKWWGRPVWSLDKAPSPSGAGNMNDYVRYQGGMHDYTQLPNGYSALALAPSDAPAPMQQMNDFVMQNDRTLMDAEDERGFMESDRYEQNGGSYDAPSLFD